MKVESWMQRHKVFILRIILVFQALGFVALLYVLYPLFGDFYEKPLVIDKTRLVIAACLLALFMAYRVGALVLGIIENRQRFRLGYLGEPPSAAHRVDREAVLKALAALDAPDSKWCPQLRNSIEEFLDLPEGTEKWEKRAMLLSNLYRTAERRTIPFETRRKVNNLRRAINLEIDAP